MSTTLTAEQTAVVDVHKSANSMLKYLSGAVSQDYDRVMKEVLSDTEYIWASQQLRKKLDDLGIDEPVGAYVGGTGQLKADSQIGGEGAQEAIRLLKDDNRLMQVGKGRGKLLVLLDKRQIKAAGTKKAKAKTEAPTPTKPTRGSENGMGDVKEILERLLNEQQASAQVVVEQTKTIKALSDKVQGLQKFIEQSNPSTW